MSKLPILYADKLIKIVEKLGYQVHHVKGSHYVLKNDQGKRIIIPFHKQKPISRKLLLGIIKDDLGMEREEFERLL